MGKKKNSGSELKSRKKRGFVERERESVKIIDGERERERATVEWRTLVGDRLKLHFYRSFCF